MRLGRGIRRILLAIICFLWSCGSCTADIAEVRGQPEPKALLPFAVGAWWVYEEWDLDGRYKGRKVWHVVEGPVDVPGGIRWKVETRADTDVISHGYRWTLDRPDVGVFEWERRVFLECPAGMEGCEFGQRQPDRDRYSFGRSRLDYSVAHTFEGAEWSVSSRESTIYITACPDPLPAGMDPCVACGSNWGGYAVWEANLERCEGSVSEQASEELFTVTVVDRPAGEAMPDFAIHRPPQDLQVFCVDRSCPEPLSDCSGDGWFCFSSGIGKVWESTEGEEELLCDWCIPTPSEPCEPPPQTAPEISERPCRPGW